MHRDTSQMNCSSERTRQQQKKTAIATVTKKKRQNQQQKDKVKCFHRKLQQSGVLDVRGSLIIVIITNSFGSYLWADICNIIDCIDVNKLSGSQPKMFFFLHRPQFIAENACKEEKKAKAEAEREKESDTHTQNSTSTTTSERKSICWLSYSFSKYLPSLLSSNYSQ